MNNIRRFLGGAKAMSPGSADAADPVDSGWVRPGREEIATAYSDILQQQVREAGIADDVVTIDMTVVGRTGDGRLALAAMIKLTAWCEQGTIRLLLGLPLFEAKVRRCLRNHWLNDVSFFAGVWLHSASATRDPKVLGRLRDMLVRLEHEQAEIARPVRPAVVLAEPGPAMPAGEGLWTVPGTLETLPGETRLHARSSR